MNFTDKKVLITGGTRGIGAAISTAFAERGARVAVSYRADDRQTSAITQRNT